MYGMYLQHHNSAAAYLSWTNMVRDEVGRDNKRATNWFSSASH